MNMYPQLYNHPLCDQTQWIRPEPGPYGGWYGQVPAFVNLIPPSAAGGWYGQMPSFVNFIPPSAAGGWYRQEPSFVNLIPSAAAGGWYGQMPSFVNLIQPSAAGGWHCQEPSFVNLMPSAASELVGENASQQNTTGCLIATDSTCESMQFMPQETAEVFESSTPPAELSEISSSSLSSPPFSPGLLLVISSSPAQTTGMLLDCNPFIASPPCPSPEMFPSSPAPLDESPATFLNSDLNVEIFSSAISQDNYTDVFQLLILASHPESSPSASPALVATHFSGFSSPLSPVPSMLPAELLASWLPSPPPAPSVSSDVLEGPSPSIAESQATTSTTALELIPLSPFIPDLPDFYT